MKPLYNEKCCDNCIHYHWYYDKCDKWNCIVDGRSCCTGFTTNEPTGDKKDSASAGQTTRKSPLVVTSTETTII